MPEKASEGVLQPIEMQRVKEGVVIVGLLGGKRPAITE